MPSRIASLPVLLATALIGAVAGITGALIVAAYVLPPTVPDPSGTAVAGRTPSVAADADALTRAAMAVVRIYGPGIETPAGTAFAPDALRGMAPVLTADGWLAADRTVAWADARLVSPAGRLLTVERSVDAPALGVVFLKTSGRDLPVAAFGDSRALLPGTTLYLPDGQGLRTANALSAVARDGVAGAAEGTGDFRRRILVQGSAPAGTPLLTLQGDVVGLALAPARGARADEVRALPVEMVRVALSRALTGAVRFPDIGARGIPLSAVAVPDMDNSARSGWYVTEVPRRTGAPALQPGDVVRSVGSDAVTAAAPLAEILAGYAVGASPELLVLRDGQELRIPVTLTLP